MKQLLFPKLFFLLITCIFFSAFAMAQTVVTGRVTDESSGEALPSVNITVKGTTKGAVSDADGHYSISLNAGESVLVFSFTGYTAKEVDVTGRTQVDVSLLSAAASLSEVLVVGYGTQQKKDVTGAVASVKGSEVQNLPVSGVTQALQGRTAGVNVVRSGGSPGNAGS
ncbi:MAG TPA: carboxypeptidase-like regulatory domain-containing protein, partial [Agriterribacter sp.]|nr:carboxypeptidase-like regulatory domain-containing protein [Agriterribacter sp.]